MAIKLKDVIRIGKVSSVNGENCAATVVFDDRDELVSAELPIITIGSNGTRGYWIPEVETQVLCLFLPNANGTGVDDGFILGAFYSTADKPVETNPDARSITFPDGSHLKFDGSGNLEIVMTGNITLRGKNIFLN